MPAQSSLEPRYSESRARSGRKAWYILIPPHLSEMGKEQRPYYENKKAAMLDAQRLQRRSDKLRAFAQCIDTCQNRTGQ